MLFRDSYPLPPTHTEAWGNLARERRESLQLIILLPLQSTVSESTLIALLAARKNKILEMKSSEPGADESSLNGRLIAYASDQVSCPPQAKPSGQGLASGALVLEPFPSRHECVRVWGSSGLCDCLQELQERTHVKCCI